MSKPGRNDPCPCGSTRKYKLCHGAVLIEPTLTPSTPSTPSTPITPTTPTGPARSCNECTACCEGWAEGEIRGHRMHPGRPCHFLRVADERPPQASPCAIYDERPVSPCRNFTCGWLATASPFPDSFRPDRVGVIIVPMQWRHRPAYVLLSAGRDPGPDLLGWMQDHARHTGAPFFYAVAGERVGYGPAEFQQEMAARLKRGERLW